MPDGTVLRLQSDQGATRRLAGVPFLVAAPLSTLDPATPDGAAVRIEERSGDALRYLRDALAPVDLPTYEPAFDVTPAELVSCLVTEAGALDHPTSESMAPWLARARSLQAAPAPGR